MNGFASVIVIASSAVSLSLVTGCSSVTTQHPFGKPYDKVKLTGTWLDADGDVMFIKHALGGKLHVAWVGWDNPSSSFKLVNDAEAQIRASKGVAYAFVRPPQDDPDADPNWIFFRVDLKDDRLFTRRPKAEYFAALVENGTLKGKVTRTRDDEDVIYIGVTLTADPSAIENAIDPKKVKEQFEPEKMVCIRTQAAAKAAFEKDEQ